MTGLPGWLLLAAVQGAASATPPPVAEASPPAAVTPVPVPADPPLLLITVDRDLSSKTMQPDEFFPIRLRYAFTLDNGQVLPAGLAGEGQVVHVSRAKGLGKGGEMIVAARYLQCGATRIALRGFRLDGAGLDNSGALIAATAVGGMIAAPLMFMKGGEYTIPHGAIGHAKLADPEVLAGAGTAGCAVAADTLPAAAVVPVAAAAPVAGKGSQQGVTK